MCGSRYSGASAESAEPEPQESSNTNSSRSSSAASAGVANREPVAISDEHVVVLYRWECLPEGVGGHLVERVVHRIGRVGRSPVWQAGCEHAGIVGVLNGQRDAALGSRRSVVVGIERDCDVTIRTRAAIGMSVEVQSAGR